MYKRLKNNKGITLISLVIVVTVLLIVSSTMVLNAQNKYNSQKLDKLASDLQLLTEKTAIYYAENKDYPTLGQTEDITIDSTTISVYKIDLTKLDGLTLNYGNVTNGADDYYVIDTSMGVIYYKKGIEGIYSLAQVESISGIQVLKIDTQPEWKKADEGESVIFSVTIDMDGVEDSSYLSYEWYKSNTYEGEGTLISDEGTRITGTSTGEITITDITTEDMGYYYCIVKYNNVNEISRKTDVAKLEVVPTPSKWKQDGINITDGTVTIQVGDYIAYDEQAGGEESYTMYVADTGCTLNSIIAKSDLNWRVLGVKEGKLELISDSVTADTIAWKGYQSYNNVVYLINTMCNTLYGDTSNGTTARGLAIEDIQEVMNLEEWNYESNDTIELSNAYYPTILTDEKNQKVNSVEGEKYGQSEQEELVSQTEQAQGNMKLKETYWTQYLNEKNFSNSIYYELFINSYSRYWLSSRCVMVGGRYDSSLSVAWFCIPFVYEGEVDALEMYSTSATIEQDYYGRGFRPVVTLGNDAGVDTSDSTKDGSSADKAYALYW